MESFEGSAFPEVIDYRILFCGSENCVSEGEHIVSSGDKLEGMVKLSISETVSNSIEDVVVEVWVCQEYNWRDFLLCRVEYFIDKDKAAPYHLVNAVI